MELDSKNKKIILCTVIFLIILIIGNASSATSLNDFSTAADLGEGGNTIKTVMAGVLQVIQSVGAVISILILIVLGIKYMAGSVEEKAEYKRMLTPYAVGAIILFAGTTLPSAIYDIVTGVVK